MKSGLVIGWIVIMLLAITIYVFSNYEKIYHIKRRLSKRVRKTLYIPLINLIIDENS